MKCPRCGADFTRNAHNQKYCSEACRRTIYLAPDRITRKIYEIPRAKKPITVIYPDVAEPDRWTRADYELYKKCIPEDAKVLFA